MKTGQKYFESLKRSEHFPVSESIAKAFEAGKQSANPSQPENKELMSLITYREIDLAKNSLYQWLKENIGTEHNGFIPDYEDIAVIMARHASQFQSRIKELEDEVERLKARL